MHEKTRQVQKLDEEICLASSASPDSVWTSAAFSRVEGQRSWQMRQMQPTCFGISDVAAGLSDVSATGDLGCIDFEIKCNQFRSPQHIQDMVETSVSLALPPSWLLPWPGIGSSLLLGLVSHGKSCCFQPPEPDGTSNTQYKAGQSFGHWLFSLDMSW